MPVFGVSVSVAGCDVPGVNKLTRSDIHFGVGARLDGFHERCGVGDWRVSGFPHELRLQSHGAYPLNLAVDVVIAFGQTDVLDLGTNLDHK